MSPVIIRVAQRGVGMLVCQDPIDVEIEKTLIQTAEDHAPGGRICMLYVRVWAYT
jgi:hypothetical protein